MGSKTNYEHRAAAKKRSEAKLKRMSGGDKG